MRLAAIVRGWEFAMKIRLNRGPVRWWLVVFGLFLARPALVPALVGAALVLLGSAIHLWSKGCLQQNRQLTVCGPYRWSRNPFYVGNFCIDLGLCLFINNWWFTAAFMLVWAFIYRLQILSEERTLDGIYGQAWLDYKLAVPAFFPCKRPYASVPAEQGFSWSNPNLATSRELPRLVRTASYPLALFLAGRLWQHWLDKSEFPMDSAYVATAFFCLAGFGALQLFAISLKAQLHRRAAVLPAALRNPYLQIALVAGFLPCLLISRGAIHAPQVLMPIGAALLVVGFYAVQRRQRQPGMFWDAVAWSCALGGAAVLAGLPWLGVLAVSGALAIVIDSHIAPAWSLAFPTFDAADEAAPSFWARMRLPSQYLLFSLVALVIALSKAHV
jgi:protein-S-isoprenylcysteine O-methyltransferase Ste14